MNQDIPPIAGSSKDERMWAMLLHLSVLLGFVIPIAGLVAPIVIWQIKKDESAMLDEHGKVVMNWLISMFIYYVLGILLTFVLIGIPILIGLSIIGVAFPIIGGLKANSGELWKYPLSMTFLR